ncbi:membrane bound O-acyl transferase family-domain-containing protein [Annulohypoxylon maeteangense]|uniref:membrane bound O-acyl transferase family-domain-containing protein n=1 Tax=Annulohypoxylon maeteangense TaxID=1927788 RepID=UPI0020083A4F|nr:membrane bound O-acyl transferase family-domain-containing protein [Annulohypoxylon maeteangense]KAI0890082.1 membrane bound O-acyl transferase family-domain-containing protein [Annulohypoxylon maeteangense]
MDHQNANLATTYRELYRAKFRDDVKAGTKTPLLVPLHLLGLWILPTLYLAIPHKNRPWLYRARWLVLAFIVIFNSNMILNVSSSDFGVAYGAGLIGAWGIVWTFTLLIWTRPQWEAKRVNIRRKRRPEDVKSNFLAEPKAHVSPQTLGNGHALTNKQQNGNCTKESSREEPKTTGLEVNGHGNNDNGSPHCIKERRIHAETLKLPEKGTDISEASSSLQENGNGVHSAAELEKLAAEQEFEYYWQEYPANDSFWTRLDWAFDIVSTFRMTGWNWAISSLPPYEPPPKAGDYQLPLSSVGPQNTRQGYSRYTSYKKLFLNRFLHHILPAYIIADFCAVSMTADPYFILGPEHTKPLPPHLSSLPPTTLFLLRTFLSFTGTLSALDLLFNAGQLALAFLPPSPQILRFRTHPWHLPTVNGSFVQVLDRGLPGFWGAWWHQTFRFGFSAPTQYLLRHGYISPNTPAAKLTAAAFAFLTSGFLHASGSYSTVPTHTRWYAPPLFFFLAGVGTMLQSALARLLHGYIAKLPRWARRAGNLAFVTVWMCATSWLLVDDFSRCGLWLFEPVPVSVFRAFGLGPEGDRRVWRMDQSFRLGWYRGERWWEVGLAV